MESLIVTGLSGFVSRRSAQVVLMRVGGSRPFLQIKPAAAIGAIDAAAIPKIKVDQGMPQGTTTAIATRPHLFDFDCLWRFHFRFHPIQIHLRTV